MRRTFWKEGSTKLYIKGLGYVVWDYNDMLTHTSEANKQHILPQHTHSPTAVHLTLCDECYAVHYRQHN